MKMFGTIAAASLLAVASAASAATISLTPVYIGSSKATVTQPAAALNPATPAALTALDFAAVDSHTSDWRHWFRVDMVFTSAPGLNEDFAYIAFDVTNSSNLQKIGRNGATTAASGAAAQFGINNPSVYDLSGDGGNDAIFVLESQTAPDVAFANQLGENGSIVSGYFYMKTLDNNAASVTVAQSNGQNFNYYTNNDVDGGGTKVVTNVGVTPGTFNIPAAGDIPEPATLSLAAIAGLGLVRRRRA